MGNDMMADISKRSARNALALSMLGFLGATCGAADAAVRIDGQVQAGGGAVAGSTVTLWAGSVGEPKLGTDETPGPGESLYLIAKGGVPSINKSASDNPVLAFLAVLG